MKSQVTMFREEKAKIIPADEVYKAVESLQEMRIAKYIVVNQKTFRKLEEISSPSIGILSIHDFVSLGIKVIVKKYLKKAYLIYN